MLSIHLFNSGDYLLLLQYQVDRTDKQMNELISQNLYNPNTFIAVKVAQHLTGVNETGAITNTSTANLVARVKT
ncbi:hypothetical protein [Mucilaginibacter sp.]